jgi:hypothetical protein
VLCSYLTLFFVPFRLQQRQFLLPAAWARPPSGSGHVSGGTQVDNRDTVQVLVFWIQGPTLNKNCSLKNILSAWICIDLDPWTRTRIHIEVKNLDPDPFETDLISFPQNSDTDPQQCYLPNYY